MCFSETISVVPRQFQRLEKFVLIIPMKHVAKVKCLSMTSFRADVKALTVGIDSLGARDTHYSRERACLVQDKPWFCPQQPRTASEPHQL